ncbi:hypothetical protein J2X60_003440 [Curtobacterium sp. 320]|uniref:hypothetical protein n=1 Tax=Curtobacterium sp. 320 TaxID=2817749 RepID=UPI002866C86B|nr:hypothetical protein [Curtobacterium sp. 320]MDR6574774.1 hypothetical protein [Curtobacterium sp. 320]
MHSPRDDDSRLGVLDGLQILGLLLAALLFAALPLAVGVVIACAVPGLGGLRTGLSSIAVLGLLIAIVILAVVIGERPLRWTAVLVPGRPRLQRPIAELVVFFLLMAALLLPLESPLGALTAAAIACGGYRCLDPLLLRLEARRARE